MAAPIIGTKGAQLDLLIRQGATFGAITTTVKNSITKQPIELTGYTIRGQIRKTAASTLQEGAAASYEILNAEQGIFAFWFTAEATEALQAGLSIRRCPSQSICLGYGNGIVRWCSTSFDVWRC